MSLTKEATMTASSASPSSGAPFVTPHKSRTSAYSSGSSSTGSSNSSTSSSTPTTAAAATPTPNRYLPLLREIQDIQEMTAESLNTSKAVYDISTGVSSTNGGGAAPATVASSPTTNSTFFTGSSFGVF